MNLELPDARHPGADLKKVLLRLARGIGHDIGRLSDDSPTRIHDIRVATKKLKALSRMAGGVIPDRRRKAIERRLKIIKSAFATSRDSEVMHKLLNKAFPSGEARRLSEVLALESSPEEFGAPPEAFSAIGDLIEMIQRSTFKRLAYDDVVGETISSYKASRKFMRQCRKSGTDETMHTWRKKVKQLGYQTATLAGEKPFRSLARRLDDLAEKLGDFHDYAVLDARLQKRAPGDKSLQKITAQKQRLFRQCFALADKCLSQKPRALTAKAE